MTREFPARKWSRSTFCDPIKRTDKLTTGNIDRKKGSGRPRSVRTAANIQLVSNFICSCALVNFDILHIIVSHKKINKSLTVRLCMGGLTVLGAGTVDIFFFG